ncbi:MAG: oligosaccharide flippase family protein [Lentisphaeraceae bacterium]|nr:oligosaccharide flippase family protein [Lentisphaeraceae bacterium]
MSVDVKKVLLRNTITNYMNLAWQMLTAIFITRFLFLGLGENLYGFWALLWTIFGYSLLLDFGFGTSVQKYTAETTVTGDYKTYNNLISAIMTSYIAMSFVIIIATCVVAYKFDVFFPSILSDDIEYYRKVFVCFGIGTAICFPTGIMPGVLYGLMRNDLRNYVIFGMHTLNVIGVYLIFKLGYSLVVLTWFTIGLNFLANIVMFFLIKRILPEFKLSITGVKYRYIKEISSFSFYAYFFTIATMVTFRTDRIVLSFMLSLGAISVYHIGTRIPEIMEKLTSQFQENLTPIAASLYKEGNTEKLSEILLKSNRIAAFMSVGAFCIFYFLAGPILFVWLDVKDEKAVMVAHIMLTSVFISVMFRSASFRFLQMAGKHKVLALLVSIEALVNVFLSIYLVKTMGVLGVALGTLIPNVLMSLFVIFPMFCRFSNLPIIHYLKKVYVPILLSVLPSAFILIFINQNMSLSDWSLAKLVMATAVAGLTYLAMTFYLFINKSERSSLLSAVSSKLRRS